jgi:hypothetical protein
MTRRKLQQLSCLRLEEAEALFKAGYYDGAGYLCGSVVGLALKAATCTTLWLDEYPEKRSRLRDALKTHDFLCGELQPAMLTMVVRTFLFSTRDSRLKVAGTSTLGVSER